jgi:folylpolyglutamate synthase
MSSLLLKHQIPAFTVLQVSEAMDVLQENARELMVTIVLSLLLSNSLFSSCFL